MQKNSRIFIAGHQGLVGSAIVRALNREGYPHLLMRSREALDLTDQQQVNAFFSDQQPEFVFLAAAKVGGIYANSTYPGDFIYQNLAIQTHVIEAARRYKTKRLLFLGSSCVYPRNCEQPMREEYLLQSALEKTNEAYAVAKIAGIKQCQFYNQQYGTDFAAIMPTNLYGQGDNFDLDNSHVLPALIRKVHDAKMAQANEVVVWGTGKALREFLHVDDMAAACLFVMQKEGCNDLLNVGSGIEISIKEVAEMICDIVGFKGRIVFDAERPDGTPRKLLDTSKLMQLGWTPKISLRDGLASTYRVFSEQFPVCSD